MKRVTVGVIPLFLLAAIALMQTMPLPTTSAAAAITPVVGIQVADADGQQIDDWQAIVFEFVEPDPANPPIPGVTEWNVIVMPPDADGDGEYEAVNVSGFFSSITGDGAVMEDVDVVHGFGKSRSQTRRGVTTYSLMWFGACSALGPIEGDILRPRDTWVSDWSVYLQDEPLLVGTIVVLGEVTIAGKTLPSYRTDGDKTFYPFEVTIGEALD